MNKYLRESINDTLESINDCHVNCCTCHKVFVYCYYYG